MTAKELLSIGVRLLGIWLIIKALTASIQAVSYLIAAESMDYDTIFWMKVFTFATPVILFLFGFIFIKMPYGIASLLIPKTQLDNTQIDWEEKLVERIGFVLLGVYILSWAIPDIFSNISYYFFYTSDRYSDINVTGLAEIKISFFILLIDILIGLLLIIGSKRAVNIIHKIRYYG